MIGYLLWALIVCLSLAWLASPAAFELAETRGEQIERSLCDFFSVMVILGSIVAAVAWLFA